MYSLDIDACRWSRLNATGVGPSDLQYGMTSWVYGRKVYTFGGVRLVGDGNLLSDSCSTNDVFCYDTCSNSWERVAQGGNSIDIFWA